MRSFQHPGDRAGDPDRYLSVAGPATAEPGRTRGSRFIADVFPAATDAEIAALLEDARRREPAATHWCWAARLGAPGSQGDAATPRYSDDGEPSGSAGLPILGEIDRRGLSDTLVIVTRYYGGTKLGTGGLARAYRKAAAAALDAARVEERVLRQALVLSFGYEDTAAALRVATKYDAEFDAPAYDGAGASLAVRVPRSSADALVSAFADATAGRGRVVGAE